MKLKVHEYCAVVGFTGRRAVICKREAKQYRCYTFERFLEEKLFRQAFCFAYYQKDPKRMDEVIQSFQQAVQAHGGLLEGHRLPETVEDMRRLYGCIAVPENLTGLIFV